ncbi:MAG: hypothetical protein IT186_24080 [Acidobacteria bacterium]|nr:hypothetical protein [Acidobacteriota bacterium]
MRDALAERLLADVMQWSPEDIARERPVLQALALYKYDEYQQFSPGMRFVESLARWLEQFADQAERQTAYEFVRSRLVFISSAELQHLVATAYPDHIRPLLIEMAAAELNLRPWQVGRVSSSVAFRALQRQTLFLGLSDGARTDVFRRANPELSNEQVLQTYDGTGDRTEDLLARLATDLRTLGLEPAVRHPRFRTIVLLDDFSASGITYIRRDESGRIGGKLGKVHRLLTSGDIAKLVHPDRVSIILVIYVGTEQTRSHVQRLWAELEGENGITLKVLLLQELAGVARLDRNAGHPIESVLQRYYDAAVEDDHTRKGGSDVQFGFGGCGLSVVLSHNTPNNTLPLLWWESAKARALFPRVRRHK